MPHDLLYLPPEAGNPFTSPIGGQMILKLSDALTGGHFSIHDNILPARSPGPRPHLHRHHEETFYVLSGELTMRAGTRQITALPGSFVVIPRGLVHQPSNPSDQPTHVLLIFSPGGMDTFFAERPLPGLPQNAEQEARLLEFLAPYGFELAELPPLE